jgi:hypothetical protein
VSVVSKERSEALSRIILFKKEPSSFSIVVSPPRIDPELLNKDLAPPLLTEN